MVRSCSRVGGLFGFIKLCLPDLLDFLAATRGSSRRNATTLPSPLPPSCRQSRPGYGGIIWCHRIGGLQPSANCSRGYACGAFHWLWHLAVWLGPFLLLTSRTDGRRRQAGAGHDPATRPEYPELPVLLYWLATLIFYGLWRGNRLARVCSAVLQERFSPLQATLMVNSHLGRLALAALPVLPGVLPT